MGNEGNARLGDFYKWDSHNLFGMLGSDYAINAARITPIATIMPW